MKAWITCLFLGVSMSVFAQNPGALPEVLSDYEQALIEDQLEDNHLNIRPQFFTQKIEPTLDGQQKDFKTIPTGLSAKPLLELSGGGSLSAENKAIYSAIGGAHLTWNKDRWFAQSTVAGFLIEGQSYVSAIQDSLHIVPGLGYSSNGPLGSNGLYATGRLNFKANDYFSFELGNDKNFWGDGYRSLILSNQAAPYPYAKITTDIWKIQYVNLWTMLSDVSRGERIGDSRRKYTSMHALSWNFHRKWNISLYEMVIWQARDTLSDRGLDLNYFNPVIFYRPIEFSLGSADNEIVGLSLRFSPNKKNQIYSQVLLDEFLFDELVDRSGWWANKFGVQLGFKSFDVLKEGLDVQSELNYVRPFTYAHGSVLQNYGHLNQSMAHPLGANFIEWVTFLKYQKENWTIQNEFIWAIYGRDRDGDNYGGNLFNSYANPFRTYGNYIAQGLKSTLHYNELNIVRHVDAALPFDISLTYMLRYESNEFFKTTENGVMLGVRVNPVGWTRDF